MNRDDCSFLLFRVGPWRFGLDATAVERVVQMVEITPLPEAPGAVEGVIDVGGGVTPVLSIRRRFGMERRAWLPEDYLILAQTSTRRVALAVEDVLGVGAKDERWVAQEEIGVPAEPVAGVVKTPEGLILIQNLDTFLFPEEEQQLVEALDRQKER